MSPASFVSLAEETGLIVPLGHWVLATACRQLAEWSKSPATAGLTLAINVSARQLRQATFVEQVRSLLLETGAPATRLKLELTESMLLEDNETITGRMAELKLLGIRFALDDFGTGYSSLAYLKRLPLSELKIDQSFVRDVLTDPNDAAIAETIVALGNTLGLEVIAEGVETDEQRRFLTQLGCRKYQGYLFGRPLPLPAFEAFLLEIGQ
jgi:EAL domain-containing protein (putative c-di-GMP-specific phosphodiesterase class I)